MINQCWGGGPEDEETIIITIATTIIIDIYISNKNMVWHLMGQLQEITSKITQFHFLPQIWKVYLKLFFFNI